MNCEYCGKSFKLKHNLNRHQKQTMCQMLKQNILQVRSEQDTNTELTARIVELEELRLKQESELTARIVELEELRLQHETKIDTLQQENNRLLIDARVSEAEVKSLQRTNEVLLNKATAKTDNTNNNMNITLNTLAPFVHSAESISEIFDKEYTRDDLKGGTKRLARFVCEKIINIGEKPIFGLSDITRGTGTYIDPEFGIVKDGKCRKLTKMIYGPCKKRSDEIIKDEQIQIDLLPDGNGDMWKNAESKGYKQILSLPNDNKIFLSEMMVHMVQV